MGTTPEQWLALRPGDAGRVASPDLPPSPCVVLRRVPGREVLIVQFPDDVAIWVYRSEFTPDEKAGA